MSMEADFNDLLLGNGTIAGIIVDRISWGEVPQGRPLPRVCLWNITRDDDRTMDGPSGFRTAMVQCDCWAESFSQAAALADAITDFVETIKHQAQGGTVFQGIFLESRRDSDEPSGGAPAARYKRVAVDLMVQHGAA